MPEAKGNKIMLRNTVPDVIILMLNWNHFIFLAIMDLETATPSVALSSFLYHSVKCVLNYKVYEKVD